MKSIILYKFRTIRMLHTVTTKLGAGIFKATSDGHRTVTGRSPKELFMKQG